jgi:hypothetical protein
MEEEHHNGSKAGYIRYLIATGKFKPNLVRHPSESLKKMNSSMYDDFTKSESVKKVRKTKSKVESEPEPDLSDYFKAQKEAEERYNMKQKERQEKYKNKTKPQLIKIIKDHYKQLGFLPHNVENNDIETLRKIASDYNM